MTLIHQTDSVETAFVYSVCLLVTLLISSQQPYRVNFQFHHYCRNEFLTQGFTQVLAIAATIRVVVSNISFQSSSSSSYSVTLWAVVDNAYPPDRTDRHWPHFW